MKKVILMLLAVFILSFSSTVSADGWHHDWSNPHYTNDWRHHDRFDGDLPFAWHEHHRHMAERYRMERIYDHRWNERFPGLHSYRWHDPGEGFWYHGRHIRDAIFFYDDEDQLVSVGFRYNGAFVVIRDNHESYESHDSFHLSWWNDHVHISINR